MISKEKLELAARQAVDNCLHAKKGEKACVITDNQTKHIGMAIANRMKEECGAVQVFVMEDFGDRPEDGSNPLKFPAKIKSFLENADLSVYAAQGKKGELKTFRKEMLSVITANKKIRHGHMININDDIMEMGMLTDYSLVQEITKKVFDIVEKAKKIRVTTNRGTDITAEFNPAWKWVPLDGNIKPGHWSNLPEGEIMACPETVNGKLVVDGILGDYMSEKFGFLEKTPLYVDVKDGRFVEVKCENKAIEDEVKKYIKQQENSNRVGEFAIGTNVGLTRLVGNLLQDEKFPGIHIAVGHPYPEQTGADWDADSHLDQVILKTTIEVDGKTIMKDGRFLI